MTEGRIDLQRRRIFAVGCFGIGAATAGFLAATFRFLVPNVLYEPPRATRRRIAATGSSRSPRNARTSDAT